MKNIIRNSWIKLSKHFLK
ncbi:hypothetical protein PFFCH_00992, partial [Plasmodium falciparum FCH/4]